MPIAISQRIKQIFNSDKPKKTSGKLAALNSAEKRHQFFNLECSELEPSNYLCWACIQQFKKAPTSKKMIFIDTHFLQPAPYTSAFNNSLSDGFKILKEVNLGDKQLAHHASALGDQLSTAKARSKFEDTMGGILDKSNPERPDAFAVLEVYMTSALTDQANRYVPGSTYLMPAGTRVFIPETSRLLTEATFNPKQMGVY